MASQSHPKSCTLCLNIWGGCLPFHNNMTLSHICLVFSFKLQFLFYLNSSSPPFSTSAINHCCLHTKDFSLPPRAFFPPGYFRLSRTLQIPSLSSTVHGVPPNSILSKRFVNKFSKSASIQQDSFKFSLNNNNF